MLRSCLLLLALCLALPLAAQTPDPNPPEAYYPLGLGDIREYRLAGGWPATPPSYRREAVVGDTLVSGIAYRLVETVDFRQDGTPYSLQRQAVRFDPALAMPAVLTGAGGEYPLAPCPFNLPFPAPDTEIMCDPGAYFVGTGPAEAAVVGTDTLVTGVRAYNGLFGGVTFAAGLGLLSAVAEVSEVLTELRYARIAGVAYGTPNPVLPPLAPEPSAYWPLEVGNTWVFSYGGGTELAWLTVQGTEVISDTTYAVVESCQRPAPTTPCREIRVRVDNRTGIVYERTMQREGELFCGLLPTAQPGAIACAGTPWLLQIDAPATVMIGTVEVPTPSLRSMVYPADTSERFAAGIGPLPSQRMGDYGAVAYARINGVEYGVNPLAGDAPPTAPVPALTASPNPTAGPLSLTVTMPAPAALNVEAFDALGRRVHRAETAVGAGEQVLEVDARGWAPGVYVVRATTVGGEAATVRVVRR